MPHGAKRTQRASNARSIPHPRAALRREAKKLVALAERRSFQAESPRAAETAAMLGSELVASLATGNGVPKS
jgi:hypothetical protein